MFESLKVPSVQGRRALLVLNCQKDNLPLAPNPPDFIARIREVIPYYRKVGTEIVWVNTDLKTKEPSDSGGESPTYDMSSYHPTSPNGPDISGPDNGTTETSHAHPRSVLGEEKPWPRLKKHVLVNDLVDELAEVQDLSRDIVVNKEYYSAFDGTPLLMCLRMKMITNIHLCGGLSNVSVMSTAADAAQHGLEVSVLEDCLAYSSEKQHLEAMQQMADKIGVSGVDSSEIVEEAGGRPPPDADPDLFLGPGLSGINISAGDGEDDDDAVAARRSVRGFNANGGGTPKSSKVKPRWQRANQPHTGPIGEGDSSLHVDALSPDLAANAFERLKSEVDWQVMKHRSGEVPRRVAVQGEVGDDGSVPVYRHPADESPPLIPFTSTVRKIRDECERLLGQPFNHVLVQLYRSGQDNISEHSDKTLDIVRGSNIVNVSYGAERRMNLRLKKSAVAKEEIRGNGSPRGSITTTTSTPNGPARESQKIPLPHNSVFVLGPKSNERWLHGIKADKRLDRERTEAEKAYGGERISLTFRNIGTFTDANRAIIWGQGARSKARAGAGKILALDSEESQKMVSAFGRENQDADFDWDAEYGAGFDALDLVVVNRPADA